jgi:hypothetical protein
MCNIKKNSQKLAFTNVFNITKNEWATNSYDTELVAQIVVWEFHTCWLNVNICFYHNTLWSDEIHLEKKITRTLVRQVYFRWVHE